MLLTESFFQVVRWPDQEGVRDHQGLERRPGDGQARGLQDSQEGVGEEANGRDQNERPLVKVSGSIPSLTFKI